jgi:predicted dehydrogenase/threonine dehydrogenase-like Zn-dependent dehydrogenase
MKQVLVQRGGVIVADLPAPHPEPGEVLVRVRTSCLSVGTEMSAVRSSATPLWKRALQDPSKVATTLKLAATAGIRSTWSLVENKLEAAHPTGYSAAGVVVGVGAQIDDVSIGDRVACAGAGYAHHAEFIRVPRNLCARVPDGLDWESASTVTLGAIALQGVRRAQPTLGESVVVIGLGVLGQLTMQILRANGCRTIGVDLDRDRLELALSLGMDVALDPDDPSAADQVARLTDGIGADCVIITAATPSDTLVSTAFKVCRRKGRVVLVGDVGLHLNRADFYAKEIDFLISTSYGPGRYDRRYEEDGLDYPVAYVRWTENRNMAEYLRLLADGRVRVQPLISARHPIEDASNAYASLTEGSSKPLMVLLTYPEAERKPSHTLSMGITIAPRPGVIRVAILGAGSFAQSAHLPNLRSLGNRFALQAVVARSGHRAEAVARQFGAAYCTTEYAQVLNDPNVDAVLIATRHNLHAELALASLRAGKHVLVEKPLAINHADLEALDAFVTSAGSSPILMTGYNRRFSPYARRMAELLKNRAGPFMLDYRVNAGRLPSDHWVHGPEGGGRNLGEACHLYDLFTFLSNSAVAEITAQSIVPISHYSRRNDNFMATMRFADGSIANLTYSALGDTSFPKETADLHVDGKTVILTDYKKLDVYGAKGKSFSTATQEKGLKEELIAFADGIRDGQWAIPWWQQMQVARAALTVESLIHRTESTTTSASL